MKSLITHPHTYFLLAIVVYLLLENFGIFLALPLALLGVYLLPVARKWKWIIVILLLTISSPFLVITTTALLLHGELGPPYAGVSIQ